MHHIPHIKSPGPQNLTASSKSNKYLCKLFTLELHGNDIGVQESGFSSFVVNVCGVYTVPLPCSLILRDVLL